MWEVHAVFLTQIGTSAGLAIGDYADLSTFPVVPEDQLQPYVQEAINQIEFITGDAKTNEWAKLRAKYGHPEPYKLKYIEIGNEDFFVSSFGLRLPRFGS